MLDATDTELCTLYMYMCMCSLEQCLSKCVYVAYERARESVCACVCVCMWRLCSALQERFCEWSQWPMAAC